MQAGVRASLVRRDRFGNPIDSQRVTMGAGDRRDLEFVVSRMPRSSSGQVTDADGAPLRLERAR